MNHLPSEYDERLNDEVLFIEGRNVFHLQMLRDYNTAKKWKQCCGETNSLQSKTEFTEGHIKDLVDGGMRPCKQCLKVIRKVLGVNACMCELCERLNLATGGLFPQVDIPHAVSGTPKVIVCSDCQGQINDNH